MNCSHASAMGSRLGLFCTTILTIISCAQFILPSTPCFVRFLHRPLGYWKKSFSSQFFTRIAVAVGVVAVVVKRGFPVSAGDPCPFGNSRQGWMAHPEAYLLFSSEGP